MALLKFLTASTIAEAPRPAASQTAVYARRKPAIDRARRSGKLRNATCRTGCSSNGNIIAAIIASQVVISLVQISARPIMIAYALPAVAGAWLGLQVFQKMSDAQFQRLVNLALIVSGITLTLK